MEFGQTETSRGYCERVQDFLDGQVYPAEPMYNRQRAELATGWGHPPIMEELKAQARREGLWNLFLSDPELGAGLTNLDYAPIAELSGRSPWIAPEAMNCSAPDTGNMEVLKDFGTAPVREQWLTPLLQGEIRSCFSMTEPQVASSDATNIATRINLQDDEIVVSGRKWWSSGAMSERCQVAIVMGVSDPLGPKHSRHSMVVVPLASPGVEIQRSTSVFGYTDSSHGGHAEIVYDDVHVPRTNLLGEPHGGFAIAQARLGPGRIHHCMRLVGMAERAFDALCERAFQRRVFGKLLAEQGVLRDWVAEARIRIEQVRLLVLKTAWLIDTVGAKGARVEISAIKVAAPAMATWVIDRAIQAHGGAGVSQDFPLAELYAQARMLRIADGPDEVHKMALARRELERYNLRGAAQGAPEQRLDEAAQ